VDNSGQQHQQATRSLIDAAPAVPEGTHAQQRRHRGGKLRRLTTPNFLLPVAVGVAFLGAWEVFGRLSDPILFAPPSSVYRAFVELTASGDLPRDLAVTLNTLIVGYVLSILVGISLGVLVGRRLVFGSILEPYLDAIYATPRVVITPLVIVWFGVGYSGRLFIVFIGTVIPIILNTAVGVRHARRDLVEVAVAFGATERELVRHVIVPGALPYVIAGLRIAAGRALLGVVIAEMFLNLTGVGGLIATAASYFHTAEMLAGVVVFAVLGIVMLSGLTWLETRVSAWKGQTSG
jgi:ABC-type nitrate/sulfonate/bicarbonate transport system permease component